MAGKQLVSDTSKKNIGAIGSFSEEEIGIFEVSIKANFTHL